MSSTNKTGKDGTLFSPETKRDHEDALNHARAEDQLGKKTDMLDNILNPKADEDEDDNNKDKKDKRNFERYMLLKTLQNQINELNLAIAELDKRITIHAGAIQLSRAEIEKLQQDLSLSQENHALLTTELEKTQNEEEKIETALDQALKTQEQTLTLKMQTQENLKGAQDDLLSKSKDAPRTLFGQDKLVQDKEGNYYTLEIDKNGLPQMTPQNAFMSAFYWAIEKLPGSKDAPDLTTDIQTLQTSHAENAKAAREHTKACTVTENLQEQQEIIKTRLLELQERYVLLETNLTTLRADLYAQQEHLQNLETELAQMQIEKADLEAKRDELIKQQQQEQEQNQSLSSTFAGLAPKGYDPEYGRVLDELRNMHPSAMSPEFLKSYFGALDPDMARRVLRDGAHYLPAHIKDLLEKPEIFGGAELSLNNIQDPDIAALPRAAHIPQCASGSDNHFAKAFNMSAAGLTLPAPAPQPKPDPTLQFSPQGNAA